MLRREQLSGLLANEKSPDADVSEETQQKITEVSCHFDIVLLMETADTH